MNIIQAINDFKDYVEITKSDGTIEYYRFYLRELKDYFKDIKCYDIDNKKVLAFIKYKKQQNESISNATLNKYITTLKTVLKYSCNIHLEFSKLKERKKLIPIISDSIIKKIYRYYDHNKDKQNELRNYLYIRLLHDTGLRLSEMNNIRVSNIDFMTNSIHIKITKTDLDRFVCFTEKTKNLLNIYIAKYKINGLLFYNLKTKEKLTTTSVETMFYRLKNKLDIKESITPHKWRHTFATNYLRYGGDLETLRLLLGHTNLKTTQKYLHLSKSDIFKNYTKVFSDME